MPDEATSQNEGSESPPHGSENNPSAATRPMRSRRKKILVPAVLAIIGLALLLAGFGAYRRGQRPEPPPPYPALCSSRAPTL
jgi:hypothetical protein